VPAPPVEEAEPFPATGEPSTLHLAVELALGGAADMSEVTAGRSRAFALSIRPELLWSWGLWVQLEVGWHFADETSPEPLALHQLPLRVAVGAVIPAERWRLRLALQGVGERWWSVGGTSRSGWRSGGGLLLGAGYRILDWLTVGADLGVELLPHGIELTYYGIPVFSMGPWRWRAAVWVSAGLDIGL
jgi:hypothetical protein